MKGDLCMVDRGIRQSRMRGPLLAALMLFLVISTLASCKGKPVATVNGEAITRDEFNKQLEDTAGAQVLDRMITEKLVFQEATKLKIEVTDKDLNAKIDEIKGSFGNEEQFQAALKQNSLTLEKLKEQLKSQIIVEKASRQGIKVSDAEIKQHYEQNKDSLYADRKLSDVKKEAEKWLIDQKARQKAVTWVEELKAKAKIVNNLYPQQEQAAQPAQPTQQQQQQPPQQTTSTSK